MNHLSIISLVCFAVVSVIASESGYYVPKGYYVIHADGQQSKLAQLTTSHQLLLHRLRRSAQFSSSSSSSSSSVSSNGGPISFNHYSSSQVSPGGISSQGYNPGVIGSLNDRFNGDDDDDYYDDGPVPFNNNRPGHPSSHIQTGTFVSNGFNGPTFTSTQTQTGNAFPSRINTQSSGGGLSPQTQTGTFVSSGFNGPSFTSSQSGNAFPNRINTQGSGGGVNYYNGNTVVSQTSSISRPTTNGIQTQSTSVLYPSANGNVVYTQSNNNGVHTQTSGVIYPNGQVQITSHKTGKY